VRPANTPLTSAQLTTIADPSPRSCSNCPRDLGGTLPEWTNWSPKFSGLGITTPPRTWTARVFGRRRLYASTASKSLLDIADLFDTVYVSFYKGLGAIAGCVWPRHRDHRGTETLADSPRGTRLRTLALRRLGAQCVAFRGDQFTSYYERARQIARVLQRIDD